MWHRMRVTEEQTREHLEEPRTNGCDVGGKEEEKPNNRRGDERSACARRPSLALRSETHLLNDSGVISVPRSFRENLSRAEQTTFPQSSNV